MIAADQPTCFPSNLLVAVSSKDDGTMLDRGCGRHAADVVANRRTFCHQIGIDYDDAVYQVIEYGQAQTFDHIAKVDNADTIKNNSQGMFADALYTETTGVGLFLPVADCIATVLYDPERQALMLAHLGRHSTVARLMTSAIRYFLAHGSRADNLQIWMSPSVKQDNYRMDYFPQASEPDWRGFYRQTADGFHLDMQGFNRSLAIQSGVPTGNILISPIDTSENPQYFSHSTGDAGGRFAVVVKILQQAHTVKIGACGMCCQKAKVQVH